MNIHSIFNKVLKKQPRPKFGKNNESNRIAWLTEILKNVPEGSKLLDAGAGQSPYKSLCSHLDYVSQDFAEYNPDTLAYGLQVTDWNYGELDIVCDIAAIPEPDASFDVILCTEVIEHIINPRDAIKEFSRLLKTGGQLILTAPFNSLTHFAPYHFYTGFSRFFYEEELKANNFNIVELNSNGNYFQYIAQELNRVPTIANVYAETQLPPSEKETLLKAITILEKLNHKDSKSSELLCYGYHVLAHKL